MTSASSDARTLAQPRPREDVHGKAVQLVRLVLDMTAEAGSGHPSSAASLAHLVAVLLYGHMRWDPARPDHPAGDRLVLSEGHACPILYAAAADLGVAIGRDGGRRPMTRADALTLRELGSPIEGHPQPATGFSFFPAATGSLGQGLSVAAGLAIAARLDGLSRRTFCLMGDGESREGQVWEALDLLVDQRLTSVCPIFNANGQGQTGPVSSQQSAGLLARKLEAFGFEPLLVDGHDPDAIAAALALHASSAEGVRGLPVAIVARTVKGWGMPSVARQVAGRHGQPLRGDDLQQARTELERTAALLGVRDGAELRPAPLPDEEPPRRSRPTRADLPDLRAALARHGEDAVLAKGKLATRKAYGHALRALGEAHPDVVVLDGDVSNSTFAETFARDPALASRFVECRIAEQAMVSCAAGLAAGGKVPFASSFGKFLGRAYDQMEMALIGGQAVRLVGSHVGVTPAADGPSQMALADAAWAAALARVRRDGRPLLHVLTPSDAWSAYALTLAMALDERASYLRTLRPDTPLLYGPQDEFRLGGHAVPRRGGDLLIAAWGYMVHVALAAAEELAAAGISPTVVDLYSLPFEAEALADLARACRWRVLTLEDNDGGALGAAVAEVLASTGAGFVHRELFVRAVPRSGRTEEDVLADLGLSAAHVVEAARTLAAG